MPRFDAGPGVSLYYEVAGQGPPLPRGRDSRRPSRGVPGAGHLGNLEAPAEFDRALREFLETAVRESTR